MATPGHNKTTTGDYSGGTSYPFAVPPPPSFYPSIYEDPRPTGFYQPPPPPVMYSFLCRFLAAIAATMAVIALIMFITSLVLKPELPAFRIDSASITSLNTTGPELTASFDITLVVTNPNRKLAISYDAVSASVLYREDGVLDFTRLPPFLQKTRSETTLRVQFAVVNEFVGNGVAKGIAADRARGSVQFGVTLLSWIRFKSGIWRWNDHLLKVDCYPLSFVFSPNNSTDVTRSQRFHFCWEIFQGKDFFVCLANIAEDLENLIIRASQIWAYHVIRPCLKGLSFQRSLTQSERWLQQDTALMVLWLPVMTRWFRILLGVKFSTWATYCKDGANEYLEYLMSKFISY